MWKQMWEEQNQENKSTNTAVTWWKGGSNINFQLKLNDTNNFFDFS